MTHSGCEPSYNFLPQEFGLPETLAALRKIVSIPNQGQIGIFP